MNKRIRLIALITTMSIVTAAGAQTNNRAAPTDGPGMAGASTNAKTGSNGIVIEGKSSKGIVIEGKAKTTPGGNTSIGPKPDEPLTPSSKTSIGPKPDEPLNPSSRTSTGPLVNPKSGTAAQSAATP